VGDAGVIFEFATARRIVFGEGRLNEAGTLAAGLGRRALVVEGASGRGGRLVELLEGSGVEASRFRVAGEPTTEVVEASVAAAIRPKAARLVAMRRCGVMGCGLPCWMARQ
jgi:alcohol dehydrogenase class IV